MFYDAGLGPKMVLVNAATGAPISATAAANSLSGTMTTQSNNSASLPAGISVQQLLQQAQQQQAAQSQQVQQQVHTNYILNHLTRLYPPLFYVSSISNYNYLFQITIPNTGGNLVSVALASPNTQALQGGAGGPQTFTLSALPPSSIMSASGNPGRSSSRPRRLISTMQVLSLSTLGCSRLMPTAAPSTICCPESPAHVASMHSMP